MDLQFSLQQPESQLGRSWTAFSPELSGSGKYLHVLGVEIIKTLLDFLGVKHPRQAVSKG